MNPLTRRRLGAMWLVTLLIWGAVGPFEPPFVELLSLKSRVLTAAGLLALLLFALDSGSWLSLFRKPYSIDKIPLWICQLAVWCGALASGISCYKWFQEPTSFVSDLGLHSVAFILSSFYLQYFIISRILSVDRKRSQTQWKLAPWMHEQLANAELRQTPLLAHLHKQIRILIVVLLSVLVFIGFVWLQLTNNEAYMLFRVASVLAVVSALTWVIAIPAAYPYALRYAIAHNIFTGDPKYIEQATRVKAVVLGKRETLTKGSPRVTDIVPMAHIDEEELLLWAASAECGSRHPFGQAIVAEAKSRYIPLEPPERFHEMTGRGVQCTIDGQAVRLGKPAFFDQQNLPGYLLDRLEVLAQEGKTPFVCARGSEYLGIIAVTEAIRSDAAAAIEDFRALGLKTILLTGEDRMTSEGLAEQLHIDRVLAEVLPEQKLHEIDKLKQAGLVVAMIGHENTDRDVLAAADLGISLTRLPGNQPSRADVVLLQNNLNRVPRFIAMSRRAVAIVKTNIVVTYLYHLIMPLLAAGVLMPLGYQPLGLVTSSCWSAALLAALFINTRRLNPTLDQTSL